MKGSLLIRTLEEGRLNTGSGGFLQYSEKVDYNPTEKVWKINGTTIDPKKVYHVGLADFLLTGGETNMAFLTPENPDIVKTYPVVTDTADPRSDSRLAIIQYMLKHQ